MNSIETVLDGYASARIQYTKVPDPTDNSNAAVRAVRVELPAIFQEVLGTRGNAALYKVSASIGEYPLNMAAIPWVAAFRKTITSGARRGYYVVLLFAEDGQAAVLTLNQGFHDFLKEYKPLAAAEKKARAVANFAATIVGVPKGFVTGPIDLGATGDFGRGYQQGAILSKIYANAASITDAEFREDLKNALDAYEELFRVAGDSLLSLLPAPTAEEFQAAVQEETKTVSPEVAPPGPRPKPPKVPRQGGTGYVRDPKVAARALALAGYKCALATDAQSHASFIARATRQNYVEAHHLVPMSRQDEFESSLDVEDNVMALCPTCHRQAHLGRTAEKRAILRRLLAMREAALDSRGISVNLEQLKHFYEVLADDD